MKVKKLYGCMDMETGELVGADLYRHKRYAWCHVGSVRTNFYRLLKGYPEQYKIVELRPIPLLGDSNG